MFRLHRPGRPGSAICKERLGPDAQARARHEARILERLADVEGVPRLAGGPVSGGTVALDDTGSVALSERVRSQRLEIPALIDLAWRLARIVAEVHRRGVVHKDINPSNILVAATEPSLMLADFDQATTFSEDRPAFVHHREIPGTLAYLAPEQTGRTGRTVDYRADLYALGMTFYELAVGRLPFADDDPLQLIHSHLVVVPQAPAEAEPRVPAGLSDIIMRLVEKEPDRRYQSAEGLAHDLSRLRERLERGETGSFPLAERDFPLRLSPPSRLFGRSSEIEVLRRTFESALDGRGRCLFVAGAPGTGKTVLIDELRPVVTARRGWFFAGKFDQYRHDTAVGAVVQVLRALGRMLLAEPEAELAAERDRILPALGPKAGLITAMVPEFAIVLGDQPKVTFADPIEAEAQLRLTVLNLLRAVASPARPVVIVLDDLQWAYPSSIRFIDSVLTGDPCPGLLLVGAYREAEIDAGHLLAALLARWERLGVAPPVLRPANLAQQDLAGMLAEMLRLQPAEAMALADAIGGRTGGNPYDTIELANALRRDGVLVPDPHGWTWDAVAIRRYVGRGEVVDLLGSRIAKLSGSAQKLLQLMACLGGNLEIGQLQAASGLSAAALEDRLAPALEDGLLVIDRATDLLAMCRDGTVRFRHDRVQQAVHNRSTPARRRSLHLAAARRLLRLPDQRGKAAEQYVCAVEAIRDPDERRLVIGLFHEAAAQGRVSANYTLVERFLAAATQLLDAGAVAPDDPDRAAIERERHLALYSLGRLAEADALYVTIERRCADPLALVESACAQVDSLFNRGKLKEAVTLGLDLLQRLGLALPDDIEAEIPRRLHEFDALISPPSGSLDDMHRPEASDPRVLAIAQLILHTATPAFFAAPPVRAWLLLECRRLWSDHGPCAELLYNLAVAPFVTIGWGQDFRTGYLVARHGVTVGALRGYEPETSRARYGFAFFAAHWFEALEQAVEQAHEAREGLQQAGDLYFSCMTYHASLMALFDCAPTLDAFEVEVEAALAIAARTGSASASAIFVPHRQMVRLMRGETRSPDDFSDADFDEAGHLARLEANPAVAVTLHSVIAISAAVFRNAPRLLRHAMEAKRRLRYATGQYRSALIRWTEALALAEQIRSAAPHERAALFAGLDRCRDWLAGRAADAPANFLHLLRSVEAERAWAAGDLWGAASAFDAALREVELRQRPWHRALIAERAALFHAAHGLERTACELLLESRTCYEAWGAVAKVRDLDRRHPFLRGARLRGSRVHDARAIHRPGPRGSSGFSSDAIDLLGVLRASQALSSETSLGQLQARIVELLGAMTGATKVLVALWRDDPPGWYLSVDGGADVVPVEDAAARGLLPIAAVRYADRTREPLLVDDATRDDRFAADPYIAPLDCCSLLLVPILSHGTPRAMLLLESRVARAAFSADRLDVVRLMAGQLAVSFDNALLYSSLESRVAERTRALEHANSRLEALSVTDPLTGLVNRRRFAELLEASTAGGGPAGPAGQLAVFMLDLDRFKGINDSLGHAAGDALLKEVARRLKAAIRRTDVLARLGGDEFAIIQSEPREDDRLGVVTDPARDVAVILANRILEAFTQPFELDGNRVFVGTSIGIAVAPTGGDAPEDLMKKADLALYEAKSGGRNGYSFYHTRMKAAANERQRLEADMHVGLARGEFELHYQPVVDVQTRTIVAREALVRWRHPMHGLLPPARFIPLAEDTGLIIPLGEWVLRRACRDAMRWPEHLTVAVNLSAVHFRKSNFVDVVRGALADAGLPPERLEIEVTETVLLGKESDSIALLHQLRSAGVSVALDDFGTGYSSLSYLKMFPFDKIKIDRSFTSDVGERADSAAIVCAIVGLARSLDIVTTAEGVETEQQLEIVRAAGVTLAQGYLFGGPQPATMLELAGTADAPCLDAPRAQPVA